MVLASASPRRSAILRALGIEHRVEPARIPEDRRSRETPDAYAERLARAKAAAVVERCPDALVLGGDTVVALDDSIIEKPTGDAEAAAMLRRLSGRDHRVVTGLALAVPGEGLRSGVRATRVRFRRLLEEEVEAYVESGDGRDKAGGYAIQGRGAALVQEIEGEYHAVVGLSVSLLVDLLERAGRPYRFGASGVPTSTMEGR